MQVISSEPDMSEKGLSAYENREPTLQTDGTSRSDGNESTELMATIPDVGIPPDGGIAAWTQVLMGHLILLNSWGFITSFGVFQTYYVTTLQRQPSDIAWVGSIQVFLLFFIGTFSGRLTDAGYFRILLFCGTCLQLLGIFMTSLCKSYVQLFLAQGVCMGLGNGLIFCPTIALVATYFTSKRALAIGITAAGSATGGVVFPLMVQQLLPKIGFGWTIRSLGLVQVFCLGLCNIFLRTRVPPRRTGALVDWQSFKDWSFVTFAVGIFFNFWGVFFAFFYLNSYARDIVGISYGESINLLIILNGIGAFGRIIPNYLADQYFGPFNSLLVATLACSVSSFCFIAVNSRGALYGWVVAYGLAAAAIQSLFPATLSNLTTDLSKSGVRIGMVFTIISFAVLTGPPIEGLLIQAHGGGYLYAQIFVGLQFFVSFVFLVIARLLTTRKLCIKL